MSATVTPAQAIAKFKSLQLKLNAPFSAETRTAFAAGETVFIAALKAAAPRKTGKYAAGIEGRTIVNPRTARIEAWGAAPLTKWLIAGTRPHDIYPRNARVLHFFTSGGTEVFAAHVFHPGTKPNPWHEAPANKAAQSIGEAMVAAVVRSLANAI